MTPKILLSLGAGQNTGAATVAKFRSDGYQIASVARTIKPEIKANSDLCLTADFADPTSLETVFTKSRGPDPLDPLFPSVEEFQHNINVNTGSVYAAGKYAIQGFDTLPQDVKKTFIVTGNNGNTAIMPNFLLLGLGKSAA